MNEGGSAANDDEANLFSENQNPAKAGETDNGQTLKTSK